jgi:hypothetical protein
MPLSAFLRELSAAGLTLTPEPRARLRLTLLGRTLTFTASPWSVRFTCAEPQITASEPAPPERADDLLAVVRDHGEQWSRRQIVPNVAEGPRLETTRLSGHSEPSAEEWGFLDPYTAARRSARAWEAGHGDGLHGLAEEVSAFAAAIVRHHLNPDPETLRRVRVTGARAAGQIVAMVRKATQ